MGAGAGARAAKGARRAPVQAVAPVAAPAASVIVISYNSRGEIGACLESLRGQRGAPPFEVVLIDHSSQDGTADLVRERFPEVKVVVQPNVGFGGGNNRGVQESRGRTLVFLNPDTEADPGFVAAMVEAAVPGQAATAQVLLKSSPGRIHTAGHRLHFTGYGFIVGYGHRKLPPGPPVPTQGVSGAAFAMRREDFDRIGGFDDDFFLYMEDTELSWRMHRAGMRIVLAPSATTLHRYVPGLASTKIAFLETGRTLLLRKHLPWWLWPAYLPSLLLAELLAWGRAAWMGPAGLAAKATAVRKGWRRGIRRYPHLPRARPHLFASQSIPFVAVSRWRLVILAGRVVNLLFRLNTLLWAVRRRPRTELLPSRRPGSV